MIKHDQSLEKQNWRQLASVQLGAAICFPTLLVGYEIAHQMGFQVAFSSILIGNAVLGLLALLTSWMSWKNPVSTAENAALSFGSLGVLLFATMLVVSMSGWFAIQTQCMSQDLCRVMTWNESSNFWTGERALRLYIGVGIVLVALSGLKGMTRMADFSLFFLVLVLLGALIKAYQLPTTSTLWNRNLWSLSFSAGGVSLVMAASVAGLVDLPTFFRHAATAKDGIFASIVTFFWALPLIELAGALLCHWTESPHLTDSLMMTQDPSWKMTILAFVLFAGWTTNNANLYSAAISLKALHSKLTPRRATLLAGILGIFLSLSNLLDHFLLALNVMGVVLASMGGVVLSFFALEQMGKGRLKSSSFPSMASWMFGAMIGMLSIFGYSMVLSSSLLEAFFASAFAMFLYYFKNSFTCLFKESHEKSII